MKYTVKSYVPEFLTRTRKALADALEDVTENDLGDALRVVPIEEGTLARSGFAQVDRDALRGQVAFDTPYAVVQELDVTLRHDAGRKAHYLGDTVEQNKRQNTEYLRDAGRRAAR